MINNNKILTVSYGTFSCTLEGFDDSFGTMKAIAEYFRDLSAGDRYFGAEPVQPDADMLAHIAQQEIARHVEARRDEGGEIVLRAADAPAAAAPAALSPADVAAPVATAAAAALATQTPSGPPPPPPDEEGPAPRQAQEPAQDDVLAEPVAAPAPAAPEEAPEDTAAFFAQTEAEEVTSYVDPMPAVDPASVLPPEDSIASKLQRIRAVVSRGDAPAMADSFAEDESSDDNFIEETTRDLEAALDEDDAYTLTEEEAADTAELDDVHGLLERISAQDVADDDAEDAAEDIAAADVVEDAAEDETETTPPQGDVEAVEDAEDDVSFDDTDTALETEADSDEAPVEATVVKVSQSDLDTALADGQLEEVYDDDDLDDGPIDLSAFVSEDQDTETGADEPLPSSLSADEEEALLRELAEVESSLGNDEDDIEETAASTEEMETMEELENEVQFYTSPTAAEYEYDAEAKAEAEAEAIADAEAEAETEATFEPEAEAEIEPEVEAADDSYDDSFDDVAEAPAEDEIAQDDTTDGAIAGILDDPKDDADRAAARLGQAGDEDLSRLMDKAATEMDEPDSSSRRSAFSHLRAAVAATKADKILGRGKNEEEDQNAYRKDLEQDLEQDVEAVKPRRPVPTTKRTERPDTDRPAPLKLVAEQRVDVEEARPSGPVQPRRVAATVADPVAADASSFADYAETMGASKLPELLEAAASYMAYVEGRDQFSRPQLMTKVRQVEQDQFSREDGLRSFGQLLRAGKIEKIKGGRFTVSDQIGFKPDEREAG